MVVTTTSYGIARGILLLHILLLTVVVIGMTSAGENTPPTVMIHTPEEGANLGLTVTVSGNATDAEGFNISSYVEARWNDWEWFGLPATPANENRSIIFGEMVNLDWHAPGAHVLQVRAFDGELYSEVVQVDVSVRDLADLVILPTDITLNPNYKEGDDMISFFVVVRNQGGEDVPRVEVVLSMDGIEVDARVMDIIRADSQTTVGFSRTIKPGNYTVKTSAFSLQPIKEKSLVNNEAERTFTFPEPEPADYPTDYLFIIGMFILFILFIVVIAIYLSAVEFRKD